MLNGHWRGKELGSCSDCWHYHEELRAGRMLVVVVLMAMLAFIGGTALTNILKANDGNQKYAKILGTTVHTGDLAAVGRDLQFIRINGTLVGGLVGLTIYLADSVL